MVGNGTWQELTTHNALDLIAQAAVMYCDATGTMPDTIRVNPLDLQRVWGSAKIWGMGVVSDNRIPYGTIYVCCRDENENQNENAGEGG